MKIWVWLVLAGIGLAIGFVGGYAVGIKNPIGRPVPIVVVGAIQGQWPDSTYDTVWVRNWAHVIIKHGGMQIWPDHVYIRKGRYRGTIYLYDRRPQPIMKHP